MKTRNIKTMQRRKTPFVTMEARCEMELVTCHARLFKKRRCDDLRACEQERYSHWISIGVCGCVQSIDFILQTTNPNSIFSTTAGKRKGKTTWKRSPHQTESQSVSPTTSRFLRSSFRILSHNIQLTRRSRTSLRSGGSSSILRILRFLRLNRIPNTRL